LLEDDQPSPMRLSSNVGLSKDESKEKKSKSSSMADETGTGIAGDEEEQIEGIIDNRHLRPQFADQLQEQEYEDRKRHASIIKYTILLFLFLLFTFYQDWLKSPK
jgi:hypothetical protein